MRFITLVLKNPFRSRARSLLAITGIAIGIATIVTLGVITEGLKTSTEDTLKAGGADFTIVESNVSDMFFSKIDEEYVDRVRNVSGVEDAVGILMAVQPLDDNPYFVLIGIDPAKINMSQIKITEGRTLQDPDADEVIMGKVASENHGKKVGDTIKIKNREYRVVGIFESGDMQQDSGAFISLKKLQRIEDKEGKVTMIYVKMTRNSAVEDVTDRIEKRYSDLTTIASLEDLQSVDQGLQTIDTATWAISLLAIIIGGIGVINTMIMSVFERTREIGVLKAVGWMDRRILAMILGESVVLTAIAGAAGSVLGVAAIQILLALGMKGFIEPVYSPEIFMRAFAVAFTVGILGGLYPAYRASRLAPTEALRYE